MIFVVLFLCVGHSPLIRQEALDLAKKYNFVTELTSLIVVQESFLDIVTRANISLYRYATLHIIMPDEDYSLPAPG